MPKSREYWQKRSLQLEEKLLSKGESYLKDLNTVYEKVTSDIEKDIRVWYSRFAKNNSISLAESKKILRNKELKELKWTIEEYIKYGQENAINQKWIKQLENASDRYHISRLEGLKLQTQQHIETLCNSQLHGTNEIFEDIYTNGYYQMAYEIQKGFNIGQNLQAINKNQIEKVLSSPWAVDGVNFSERIWNNRTELINVLHKELFSMIARGEAPDKIMNKIATKLNASRKNAGRLVMTESAFFASTSQKDCFNDLGVQQYEIVATLDIKTSEICRELDGKVFDMKDYQVGSTAPPFHPWCRTCTVPYFEDDEFGQRAARDKNGKTTYVPSNMDYKEWYEKYVKNDSEYTLLEKKHKNKYSDKKQHKKYMEVLGDEIPEKLDDFQNLKYTDTKKWEKIKSKYNKDSNKYKQYNYTDDGIIIITDDRKGEHFSPPREYKPFAVIETSKDFGNGITQIDRTLYDENSIMKKQIHSSHHNRPKHHKLGKNGEHCHIYEWDENGKCVDRSPKELSDKDRLEHRDILGDG